MNKQIQTIDIPGAFDAHFHARQDDKMSLVMGYLTARWCGATFMPNLKEPVTTLSRVWKYRDEIFAHISKDLPFTPVLTCYLTESTSLDELEAGFKHKLWWAAKLYMCMPGGHGGTTGAENGVTDISKIWPMLELMEKIGMPLLIHGEVVRPDVDEFDREKYFIDEIWEQVVRNFPKLKWVLEHISTKDAVDFVRDMTVIGIPCRATITPHHAMVNRNALFERGLQPQNYCRPILKREENRLAVRKAMVSGEECFGAGSDAAIHWNEDKFKPCGAAGIYNGNASIELYAQIFEEDGMFQNDDCRGHFRRFVSANIPSLYGLPPIKGVVRLERTPWEMPLICSLEDELGLHRVIPFLAGKTINWKAKRIA